MESGSAHFLVLLTVGTLACRAIGVGPIGIGSLAMQALGALLVVKVVGMWSMREWLVGGLVVVVVSLGKVWLGLQWEDYVGSAQLVVISRMCLKVSPPFGGVVVPKVEGGMRVFLVLGVGRVRFEEEVQGGGVGAAGFQGVEEPLPPGRVLSQREHALGALNTLIQVLGPEIWASG